MSAGGVGRLDGATPAPGLRWQSVFWVGLVLWLASVGLLVATRAINLVPTVILLGSFLVPVTAVVFGTDHDVSPQVGPRTVLFAFVIGGLLGIYGAVLGEALLLPPGPLQYLGVGLIEEGAKLLALVFVARRLGRYTTRDGIVLGATVGFGFAALESSGYAFTALLTRQGLSVTGLVQTEVLRGVLAPVGHGLWTGILGGVLFREAQGAGRLRLTGAVVAAYLGVAVLHGLWDSMADLALLATYQLTASPAQRAAVAAGQQLSPTDVTDAQQAVFTACYAGGLLLVSAVGVWWLVRQWRSARPAPTGPSAPGDGRGLAGGADDAPATL
jgi:protease PrsW